MARQLFEPWAVRLLGRVSLPAGATVLDVATAPGTVARLVASRVGPTGRVVASDTASVITHYPPAAAIARTARISQRRDRLPARICTGR